MMSRLILKLNAPNQVDQAKCVYFLSKIASMCKSAANTDENLESELKRYENHFESSIESESFYIVYIFFK